MKYIICILYVCGIIKHTHPPTKANAKTKSKKKIILEFYVSSFFSFKECFVVVVVVDK